VKRVFISGANGFIGKAIVDEMKSTSSSVIYGIPSSSELDLREFKSVKSYLREFKPDLVLHCAARLPFGSTEEVAFEETCEIDLNVCNSLLETNKKTKLIYASGTSVYLNDGEVITENTKLFSENKYIKAKINGERLFQMNLFNASIFRISAPYGVGQKIETVLHKFVKKSVKNESIGIFGNGERVQNFTNIDDIVKAFILAGEMKVNGVYNICSDRAISMKLLAEKIISLSQSHSQLLFKDKVDSDPTYILKLSNKKAKRELDWNPEVSLDLGLKKIINAYSSIV
jgi:nucleoside-diphosphate-sugar epimerase